MKNSAKFLLSLASLVLLATPILRADEPDANQTGKPGGPERRQERREEMRENMKKMAKELNLTADQQAKIKSIRQQTGTALKALRDDTSLSKEQRREKAQALRKSTEEQVHAILTPEQQQKARELREKHGRHKPPAPGN